MSTEAWLGYVAGYLDGEGCFTVSAGSTARVSITNTFPKVLEEIKSVFGGEIYYRGEHGLKAGHRPHYNYFLNGSAAKGLCSLLIPYLNEKKLQAQLLLDLNEYPIRSATRADILRRLKEEKRRVH